MSDYIDEEERLRRRYDEAVGWALQYGIKVYTPGTGKSGDLGPWAKSLGDLENEIRMREGRDPRTFEDYYAEALDAQESCHPTDGVR